MRGQVTGSGRPGDASKAQGKSWRRVAGGAGWQLGRRGQASMGGKQDGQALIRTGTHLPCNVSSLPPSFPLLHTHSTGRRGLSAVKGLATRFGLRRHRRRAAPSFARPAR